MEQKSPSNFVTTYTSGHKKQPNHATYDSQHISHLFSRKAQITSSIRELETNIYVSFGITIDTLRTQIAESKSELCRIDTELRSYNIKRLWNENAYRDFTHAHILDREMPMWRIGLNGSNMEKKEFLRQYPKICIDEDWQYWMADGSACAR